MLLRATTMAFTHKGKTVKLVLRKISDHYWQVQAYRATMHTDDLKTPFHTLELPSLGKEVAIQHTGVVLDRYAGYIGRMLNSNEPFFDKFVV